MTDLVVWRHGRTEYNDTGRFQGHLDTELDAVGHAQARAAAARLASLRPARVVTSDLARAASTAEYLGARCSVEVERDPRLREVDVGEWSGLSRDEIAERYPEDYAAWMRGEDVRRGGGETSPEVVARATAAVAERLPCDGPLVVVTHGGTSRDLVIALLGLPRESRRVFAVLGNARWAELVRHGDGWRLTSYNVGVEENGDAATEPVL
ncbi:MAG TPA: histidine phosphatase family protein [Mycobacteriales bacterium]